MRTVIYVDGYNFYYSRLKGTPYKWLDVVALFRDQILAEQSPGAEVVKVKFFTAPVKASYARHGVDSEHAQTQYHRALLNRHEGLVEIVQGFHVFEPSHLPRYEEGQGANKAITHPVWLIEEKQTDVNLALHMYRDALKQGLDQIVVCCNDSDIEPSLAWIRQDAPAVKIGLVMPLHADKPKRQASVPNKRLTRLADWVRHAIRDSELLAAQLPPKVMTRKKPAVKPAHW